MLGCSVSYIHGILVHFFISLSISMRHHQLITQVLPCSWAYSMYGRSVGRLTVSLQYGGTIHTVSDISGGQGPQWLTNKTALPSLTQVQVSL